MPPNLRDVRRKRADEYSADAAQPPADDQNDDNDDDYDGPEKPQKKHFRTRAHSNVLNANDFWFPPTPDDVPLDSYFPGLPAAARTIEFVDIGCGYGSLLMELCAVFPSTPMLGIEIRPKVVEYVQRRVAVLRHEAKGKSTSGAAAATTASASGSDAATTAADASADASAATSSSTTSPLLDYENVWAIHNNAQRFMPNFFRKEQLSKLFFCFADPHFKRKNHRKRIVSHALLAEYAYVLKPLGLAYVITDVAELMSWMVEHFSQSVLFERLPREELKSDPTVPTLIRTDEGLKVQRNNGNMYIAVFRKRADPLAPRPPPPPNDNAAAADAAADAGYRPLAGGERRGMTW